MTYCTKCGKPTNNGIMCEDCIVSDSPWLLAMKAKEDDLVEQIEKLKAENAALHERLNKAVELPCAKVVKTKEWIDRVEVGDIMWEWAVIYIDRQGEFVVEPCRSKIAADARLRELQGEKQ